MIMGLGSWIDLIFFPSISLVKLVRVCMCDREKERVKVCSSVCLLLVLIYYLTVFHSFSILFNELKVTVTYYLYIIYVCIYRCIQKYSIYIKISKY